MKRVVTSATMFALAAMAIPQTAWAQGQETLRLSKALYFDCAISATKDPAKLVDFDVSYVVYADQPGRPQVNFLDPTKVFFQQTGWAAEGRFALSRLTSDGRLFVWLGQFREPGLPQIDQTIELTPDSAQAEQAGISVRHFTENDNGIVLPREFAGVCQTLTGKGAWDRFQEGSAG